jgi:hypothetical protein
VQTKAGKAASRALKSSFSSPVPKARRGSNWCCSPQRRREIWFPPKRRVESYLRGPLAWRHTQLSPQPAAPIPSTRMCVAFAKRVVAMKLGSSWALITQACSYSSFTPQFEHCAPHYSHTQFYSGCVYVCIGEEVQPDRCLPLEPHQRLSPN